MTTARGKGNRGVKGRRVIYGGDEWTVAYVTPSGALGLTRDHRNRTWTTGDIPREHVKFVKHDYTDRCWYKIPRPFRRQISQCRKRAVSGARYCAFHLCPCGIGPFTHSHNEK
jgi:hypothetical protein